MGRLLQDGGEPAHAVRRSGRGARHVRQLRGRQGGLHPKRGHVRLQRRVSVRCGRLEIT